MKVNVNVDWTNFNWRRWVETRRFLVWAIGVIILALIMGIFALFPQISSDFDLANGIQIEQLTLNRYQQKVDALQQAANLKTPDNEHKVNLALPSQKPLIQLLATANTVAQQAQVTISEVDTSPGTLATGSARSSGSGTTTALSAVSAFKGPPNVQPLQINLTVKGTLPQINAFIQQIEQATPLVDITEIDLTSLDSSGTFVSGANATTPFQAKLGVVTYYYSQTVTLITDAPLPELGPREQTFLQTLNSFTFPEVQKQNTIQGGGLNDLFGVSGNGGNGGSAGTGSGQ